MLQGFKEFISKGNVIDLAVGVVIGAAFTALVNSFVANLINPILGLFGTKNLNQYVWCIKAPEGGVCGYDDKGVLQGVGIGWGAILSAIITFLLTAMLVYFIFVVPMNKYRARTAVEEVEETAEEIALLREIRDSLRHEH